MENYIVLHKINGVCVSRWDFGESITKATEFFLELRSNYKSLFPQNGDHTVEIKNERCRYYYNFFAFTVI